MKPTKEIQFDFDFDFKSGLGSEAYHRYNGILATAKTKLNALNPAGVSDAAKHNQKLALNSIEDYSKILYTNAKKYTLKQICEMEEKVFQFSEGGQKSEKYLQLFSELNTFNKVLSTMEHTKVPKQIDDCGSVIKRITECIATVKATSAANDLLANRKKFEQLSLDSETFDEGNEDSLRAFSRYKCLLDEDLRLFKDLESINPQNMKRKLVNYKRKVQRAKRVLKSKGKRCCEIAYETLENWSKNHFDELNDKIRYFNDSESTDYFKNLDQQLLRQIARFEEIDASNLSVNVPLGMNSMKTRLEKSRENLYKRGRKFDLGSRRIMSTLPGMKKS